MGDLIYNLLPIGLASIGIVIVAVILLLSLNNGLVKALSLNLGLILFYLLVGIIWMSFVDTGIEATNQTGVINSIIKLVLAILLFYLAIKKILTPVKKSESLPSWFEGINSMKPGKLVGFGMLLGFLTVKNLILYISGMVQINQLSNNYLEGFIALLVLTILIAWWNFIPIIIFVVMPKKSTQILNSLKEWVLRNNRIIMIVILLVFGVKLLGDALVGFGIL